MTVLGPQAVSEIEDVVRRFAKLYFTKPQDMRWRGNAKPAIFKGKVVGGISKGTTGSVEIWKGTNPNEEATGVIITCMNYYHDIAAGRWCHFIRVKPDFGELIAGDVCD